MKIGILTLPLHTNYGGILQAYALQTVLERMGHEVWVLTPPKVRFELPLYKKIGAYPKRIVAKYLFGRNVKVNYEHLLDVTNAIVSKYTDSFICHYIHSYPIQQLSDIPQDFFDAIVVGSDQVWRKIYFTQSFSNKIENAFLGFAERWTIKKIAYAPSFGTDYLELDQQEIQRCAYLLKSFTAVSVREQTAVELCDIFFHIDAVHVLDPTMLLDASDYLTLVNGNSSSLVQCSGNLHCYILDSNVEKDALVSFIAQHRKLEPFSIGKDLYNLDIDVVERVQPPVEQWLKAFNDSDFIITDSFHACVFSILFRKQFVVYGNKARGMERFHSLLSIMGLDNRLITSSAEYLTLDEINFDDVYKKLADWRIKSNAFLLSALQQ